MLHGPGGASAAASRTKSGDCGGKNELAALQVLVGEELVWTV